MDDLFRLITQYLHVFAGILWLGGGFYVLLVQVPGILAAPPQARGPVVAQIAPRQVWYILRVAELTLVTGVLNVFATGRARQFEDPLGQRWTVVLGLGIILAVALYGLVRATVVPWTRRMLELGPRAGSGDAAAQAEVALIVGRLRNSGRVQIAMGALIILAMVAARLS